jgi:ketosteroid isomerase-like protein
MARSVTAGAELYRASPGTRNQFIPDGFWCEGGGKAVYLKRQKSIGRKRMIPARVTIGAVATIWLGVLTPALPQQSEPAAGGELFEKMQSDFAEAYNRKDVAAMANFFSENGVRVTPAGVFRGREAIGRELKRVVVDLGLHDYSVKRTVSRLQGNMVFNAGEWKATLGDGKQYHGYYAALLVREGDGVKIFEETTNVAVP